MKNIKAQFWSFDIVFAIIIFAAAVTVVSFAWLSLTNQLGLNSQNGAQIMQIQEQSLAGTLLSVGSPQNWQSVVNVSNTNTWSNVSVGLAAGPNSRVLSTAKIFALMAMANTNQNSYEASKQALGVGYEYYITIVSSSYNISIGENPLTNNAVTVYTDRQNVIINGNPAQMSVDVWTAQASGIV